MRTPNGAEAADSNPVEEEALRQDVINALAWIHDPATATLQASAWTTPVDKQ
jgi:hypothetical protein